MIVLGLLMMAGLGFAATAIIDHMDSQTADDGPPQDEDETSSHGSMPDELGPHGSLLNDPDPQVGADTHAHSAPEVHQQDSQHDNNGHDPAGQQHAPLGHHQQSHHHQPAHHTPSHQQASNHHPSVHHQTDHHQQHHAHSGQHDAGHQPASHHTGARTAPTSKVFGGDGNDTLHGTSHADLIDGNGGDDKLLGHGGDDHLVGFNAGHDTLVGGAGNDSLHGYMVQKQPGDLSYVVEDHQADHLLGGAGKDSLFLGSDDVGTGGQGADSFHVSWDVEHGHPAQITDYNPKLDKIYVEYTSNHANEGMTDIKPEEQTITTEPMKDGAGTSILINGQAIAHVLGAAHLTASDIGLIHA